MGLLVNTEEIPELAPTQYNVNLKCFMVTNTQMEPINTDTYQ